VNVSNVTAASPSGRNGPVDTVLAAVVIALLGFGVVMVYSASVIEATVVFRDSQYFLKRQGFYALGALILIFGISRIDYRKLRPLTYPIIGLVTVMMILSVIGFGHSGGGAARWLSVGPIHIQPSETAKLGLVLWLAYSLEKKRERVRSFSIGMLPHLLMSGFLMVLCLKQPDFGGASVLLLQKWEHDTPAWMALDTAAQEQAMGRTKPDSVELDDKAATSHVARTDQDTYGHIFRRNTPYGTPAEHGTMFVGFCAEQRPLAAMLESMAGLDGPRDELTRYTRPLTGAYYVIPPTDALAAA